MNRDRSSRPIPPNDEYGYRIHGKTPGEDSAEDRSFFDNLSHPSKWFSREKDTSEYNRLNREARNDADRNTHGMHVPQQPMDSYIPSGIRPEHQSQPQRGPLQRELLQRGLLRGKGPRNYKRSDDRISEEVHHILTEHGEINATDVYVSVHNGEVTLEGTVSDKHTKWLAEESIADLTGVTNVINELKIKPSYEPLTTAQEETQGQWYTRMLGKWES